MYLHVDTKAALSRRGLCQPVAAWIGSSKFKNNLLLLKSDEMRINGGDGKIACEWGRYENGHLRDHMGPKEYEVMRVQPTRSAIPLMSAQPGSFLIFSRMVRR